MSDTSTRAALEALNRYVHHLAWCDRRYDLPLRCRCGLKQTLAALAAPSTETTDALDEWNEQELKADYWTGGPLAPSTEKDG